MENSYLRTRRSLSPAVAGAGFGSFFNNLNEQEMEWYDTFRTHVTCRIKQDDFAPMFDDHVRTLLPTSTMAAMIALAEGFGWNDERTVNECLADLRVRHALGIGDTQGVPSMEMIALFRNLMTTYSNDHNDHGIDLMDNLKQRLSAGQGPVRRLSSGRIILWAMQVA